jgi:hypothetical protein
LAIGREWRYSIQNRPVEIGANMNPDIKVAEPLPNYKLKVQFTNNELKEFDVAPYLNKGVFSELKDEQYFKQVRVAFGSIEWPNEQDFSKDTVYLLGRPLES